uniref:Uncharacterized protein n=1 Tax=mine drainage metagenome TaxID=410659 RepID=E6QSY3_9ZZZZ
MVRGANFRTKIILDTDENGTLPFIYAVRADMVEREEGYRWSGAAAHAGTDQTAC